LTAVKTNQAIRVILLDIEGTTTPIDFVYKVLFPFANARAKEFLSWHISSADVQSDLAALRKDHAEDVRAGQNPPAWSDDSQDAEVASAVAYIEWLTAKDRKSTVLKSIQGKIWEQGYRSGELRAQVFDDVPRALKRWHDQKKEVSIFSSGSVLAQKLLFAHTSHGDLTPYISQHFDTTTGSKTKAQSYVSIAKALRGAPSEILFISDVVAELDAAKYAGFETLLCERPGNRPQPVNKHKKIRSFDGVFP
jgi:enolase-phosphatase E1